jgi:cell division protein FtsZ
MMNLGIPDQNSELRPRIVVVGVGGAGGNAVNNMIRANLEGVEFLVTNTDAQALRGSLAQNKVQLGLESTRGLGAGSRPEVGRASAEETMKELVGHLEGAHMVFITAGMGGGTGTGAAPVIARACRDNGMLTVGVVTKPFHFEGAHRMRTAESGIKELQQYVDTLIIIPNQNLFRVANEKTTFADAFKMADDVLHSGVRGVTDLMVMPGLINLDFADIKTVMQEMGKAMMGTGEAVGDRRAIEAAEAAISNPLLDDVSMKGARGILINITGGIDMTLFEVDEAANRIREEVDPDANIIFGSTFDQNMEGKMRVSVVATGIEAERVAGHQGIGLGVADAIAQQRQQQRPVAPAPAIGLRPGMGAAPAPLTLAPLNGAPDLGASDLFVAAALAEMNEPAPSNLAAHVTVAPVTAAPVFAVDYNAEPLSISVPAPQITQPARTENVAEDVAENSFVPPAPVVAPPRPNLSAGNLSTGTEQVSAHPAKPKKGLASLFERMTGNRSVDVPVVAPRMAPPRGQPAQMSAPSLRPNVRGGAQPALQQSTSLNIAPAERPIISQSDEEMLNIPAFLRRQAN